MDKKVDINEVAKIIYKDSHLKECDYFDSTVFYYLSGRFPHLTIDQCVEIVDIVRKNLLQQRISSRSRGMSLRG